jgi:hypothetical protein
MDYKIYKIENINNNNVVYIGLTKRSLQKRFASHFSDKNRNKKKYNYFKKYKSSLEISLIEGNISTLKEANEKEVFYIKKYKDLGSKLLNHTEGGDGTKGFNPWNKNKKCTYINKLIENSPNAKKIYSYDLNGNYLRDYNSIKKAYEQTGVPRSAIKNIADLKKSYVSYKGLTFRYYKKNKIELNYIAEKTRIKNIIKSKKEKKLNVSLFFIESNEKLFFKNTELASEFLSMNKNTVRAYCSSNLKRKNIIFKYEKDR